MTDSRTLMVGDPHCASKVRAAVTSSRDDMQIAGAKSDVEFQLEDDAGRRLNDCSLSLPARHSKSSRNSPDTVLALPEEYPQRLSLFRRKAGDCSFCGVYSLGTLTLWFAGVVTQLPLKRGNYFP